VILVRLLLFLSLAAIAVSALLYLYSKDRRYLRFIGQVLKSALVILAVILVYFAFERIVGPML
jgi:4-hydroxybenzoate polyprenyltransferase